MRAAIYARVSTARQREAHTIENQLRVLPAFVASQGWTLAGTYVDDGRSAKAGKLEARDGFARLVRDAEAAAFDVLVVIDVDRLTRTDDMRERAEILGPFQRAGIQIVTPSGGALDLRTFLGELYVTMQALVAAEENRKRAERIKAGKLRAIAEGRKPAGPTPFGLAYNRATGTWSVNEPAAAIVREMFRRVIDGESCLEIAHDLDARAIAPPRGGWARHTVWRIVRSRHTVGEWIADKRKHLVVSVPAIIDEATWQAAQESLIEHGKRGLVKTKHVYLLEGLGTCSRCGSPIAIRSASPGRGGYVNPAAYVCRSRKLERRGEHRCGASVLKIADVDERVWTAVSEAIQGEQMATALRQRFAARESDRRDWEQDVAKYRTHIERLKRAETGVLARFRKGTVSEDALDAELAAIARERSAVQAQLATAERAAKADDVPQADVDAILAELRTLAESSSPAARQRVVRAIVKRGDAVFDDGRVKLRLLIEPVERERSAPVLAVASGCRTHHGDSVQLRVVA